ncbi:MAG: hypothetical protein AAFQ14_14360 [Cyanobacteria bacterium J06621_12]
MTLRLYFYLLVAGVGMFAYAVYVFDYCRDRRLKIFSYMALVFAGLFLVPIYTGFSKLLHHFNTFFILSGVLSA